MAETTNSSSVKKSRSARISWVDWAMTLVGISKETRSNPSRETLTAISNMYLFMQSLNSSRLNVGCS